MWRTAVNQGTEAWPVKPWMHLKGKSCMMNPEARSLGKWRGGGGGNCNVVLSQPKFTTNKDREMGRDGF